MLLSTAHFPPIQYFCKIINLKEFAIESCENLQKQSYRNRHKVLAANGPIDLTVPLHKGRSPGQLIKDVRLDYSESWNKTHRKTILSAYNHSPFYEYYIDDILPYWEKQWKYLYDYNYEILMTLFDLLDLNIRILDTTEYTAPISNNDLRILIHPKKSLDLDTEFKPQVYTQNFSDRHGFFANLSILDLLFQTGPEAVKIIKDSVVKSKDSVLRK